MTLLTFKNFLSASSRHSIEIGKLAEQGKIKTQEDYITMLYDKLKDDFDIIPIVKDDPQDDEGFIEVELPITQP